MLELLKEYYVFMLMIMVISYMVPKEEYKTYIQFFVGIFVVVLFLEPILSLLNTDSSNLVTEIFEGLNSQMEIIEEQNIIESEGNIFEFFFFKGEGE